MIFYFCLNKKDKIELAHDAALNHVTEKEKPRCKLSYKLFKEQDGYDPLLDISTFSTLIQLKEFIDGVQHCVTVVGKWIFDSTFPFVLPLTCDNLE